MSIQSHDVGAELAPHGFGLLSATSLIKDTRASYVKEPIKWRLRLLAREIPGYKWQSIMLPSQSFLLIRLQVSLSRTTGIRYSLRNTAIPQMLIQTKVIAFSALQTMKHTRTSILPQSRVHVDGSSIIPSFRNGRATTMKISFGFLQILAVGCRFYPRHWLMMLSLEIRQLRYAISFSRTIRSKIVWQLRSVLSCIKSIAPKQNFLRNMQKEKYTKMESG